MSDFINTYMQNVLTNSEAASFLQVARSQLLTRPLTLFYAMRLLEYAPERRDLIIHVVDANVLEESSLMGWSVLLDLIDVSSVIIVMIGPTLKLQSPLSRDFDGLRRKKYLLEFHPVLYEEYVRSPSFVKPDLVVGFNAYILYELDSPKETWAPAIRLIAKQNCPFVLTCYERRYLKYKADRINTILDREIDYLYSGENPFASLKPNRCLKVQKVQKVCYQNQCILVYRSLCP
ncbi:PREDICTED: putative protein MSS51 homolog, mitochondrial [Vollenhovia emeryi]|uniref:putative protein MSS51 homolog, mitochondrial n=1 Tax=Vollenhovia emeryi TaxID=411798 RepID=UPI0005F45D86|nr:PREDICTED: putative protein MSS51 homolog, mitochondrial [Vollenhovia emeryi]